MQSVFSSPNPVLFGIGTSKLIGEKLRELGCTKVLLIFDKGIKASGIADSISGMINASGIDTVLFDGVLADPPDWSVEEAGALGVREGVDGVVGLGGGSSLDTAKAAKMLLTNPPPISRYFGREGIIDPELTVGLPPSVTASTGMDALCHAVESYTSQLANSFCQVTGMEAIRLVGKYLVEACENGSNLEAREGMMLAATLGGISMSGPLCHLAHDIGKVLGAKFHVPHGNGCASCLPQVLEVIAPAVPEKVRYVADSLGAEIPADASAEQIGKAAYDVVKALMQRLKLPNLKSFGMSKEELLAVVPEGVQMQQERLIKLFGRATSPVPATTELVADIVSRAYDEN